MKPAISRSFPVLMFLLFFTPAQGAYYDSSTGQIHLSAVFDGQNTYFDAIITLMPNGTYTIDGLESALPLRCETEFSETTLQLIDDNMNVDQINQALGCHWSYYSEDAFLLPSTETYTWVDRNCTQLDVSPVIEDQNLFHESLLYVSSCELNPDGNGLYDLTAERFVIDTILIDDVVAAPDVILAFNTIQQTISLISAVVRPMSDPPPICSLFSQDLLNTGVGTATTPAELADELGCQWTYNIVTTDQGAGSVSQVFWDHECNSLYAFINKTTGLITGLQFNYRRTGCGF